MGDRVRAVLVYSNGTDMERLARGTPMLSLRPMEGRTSKRHMQARLRMAIGGQHIVGWAVYDRPLPELPDSIRKVEIAGERAAWNRWDWHLNVTVRQPLVAREGDDAERSEALAIDLRWRVEDRWLQVAHWMDTDGDEGEIAQDLAMTWAPGSKRAGLSSTWADYEQLQRAADESVERIKAAIWMRYRGEEPVSESFRRTGSAGLARAIARGDYAEMGGGAVHRWAFEHGVARQKAARLRQRLIARRDHQYYEAAHALCRRTRVIVFEGEDRTARRMSLAKLAEGDEARAGGQRHMASPFRLRVIIAHVARRYGVEIATASTLRLTRCAECGEYVEAKGAIIVTCSQGHRFDTRRAQCRELLARWREGRGGGEKGGGARDGNPPANQARSRRGDGGKRRRSATRREALASAGKR